MMADAAGSPAGLQRARLGPAPIWRLPDQHLAERFASGGKEVGPVASWKHHQPSEYRSVRAARFVDRAGSLARGFM